MESEIIKGLISSDCFRVLNSGEIDEILEVNITNWYDVIDEESLHTHTFGFSRISFIMTDVVQVSQSVLELLNRYVSPKLISISITNCNNLTWSTVRKILEPASMVSSVSVKKNVWVTDPIVEQLAIKFSKSLQSLDLEFNQITDDCLFHLGRRCLALRSVKFDCCPKLTDAGFLELSRRIHLSSLSISHNMHITDKGLEVVLSNCRSLTSIHIVNCPLLTDRSIAALYEAIVSWGKKRNTKSQSLQALELRDNSNFTAQTLIWFAAAISIHCLKALDIRECPNIDLTSGLPELEQHSAIVDLRVGSTDPCPYPMNSNAFIQSVLFHSPQLLTLHLVGLNTLTDKHIAEILSATFDLEELSLTNMNCGTLCIEAICSAIPNVKHVVIVGSNILNDAALRCLTCVCLHMKRLEVARCPLISDVAFSRCVILRRLKSFKVSSLSAGRVIGSLLSTLALCPLEELTVEHMPKVVMLPHVQKMSGLTLQAIRTISLAGCSSVTVEDVLFFLRMCPRCTSLDLSSCENVSSAAAIQAMTDGNLHPFMTYVAENKGSFCGFKVQPAAMVQFNRFYGKLQSIRKYILCHKVVRIFQLYLQEQSRRRGQNQQDQIAYRVAMATKLQSIGRMRVAKLLVARYRTAGTVIVAKAKKFLFRRYVQKMRKARVLLRRSVLKQFFHALYAYTKGSKDQLLTRAKKIVPALRKRMKRRIFGYAYRNARGSILLKRDKVAEVIWEMKIKANIMRHWQRMLGYSLKRVTALCTCLMLIAPLSYYNNFKQQLAFARMTDFVFRKYLVYGWSGFCMDRIGAQRAMKLMPMAIAHFSQSFLFRVLRVVYQAFISYRLVKKWKRAQLAKGLEHYGVWMIVTSVAKLRRRTLLLRGVRLAWNRAENTRMDYFFRSALRNCFPFRVKVRIYERMIGQQMQSFFNWKYLCKFRHMMANIVKIKELRVLNVLADRKIYATRSKYFMRYWKLYTKFSKDAEEFCFQKYCTSLIKKGFDSFVLFQRDAIAYRDKMMADMLTKTTADNARALLIAGIISLQALCRGAITREEVVALRIQQLYAIQIMQNFIRSTMAYRRVRVFKRKAILSLTIAEEFELNKMRDEEADSLFYMLLYTSAIKVQRIFRGFLDKERVHVLGRARTRHRGLAFREANILLRNRRERFALAEIAREHHREASSTQIQAVIRGAAARRQFIRLKFQAKLEFYVLFVQTEYRRKLAMNKLAALRRGKVVELRALKARRERGVYLRLAGYNTRKSQRKIAGILELLGIDPLSFNFNLRELWTDTVNDFRDFKYIMRREFSLYKLFRGHRMKMQSASRRILMEFGFMLKLGDAVVVVDPTHAFFGHTGRLVWIDSDVAGPALFEIALDRVDRQSFANMTMDPLEAYNTLQPFVRAETRPVLKGLKQPFLMYGMNVEDDFFCKKNVTSACVIQRGWRCSRAHKYTARKRFEFWQRNLCMNGNVSGQMSGTGTITGQAQSIAKRWGLGSKLNVAYHEIGHPLLPHRLVAMSKMAPEELAIKEEMDDMYDKRMMYLKKAAMTVAETNTSFKIGYERMTKTRKFSHLGQVCLGFVSRGLSSIRDMVGRKGAKVLAKRSCIVTGLDGYKFPQFQGSPHVSYSKKTLYQGEWSGIPLFTPLVPHGEGTLVFLNAFGFSREDKVLYLKIVCAKRLMAMDVMSSDPYCEIMCNGTTVQTSVKWGQLNPRWDESFDIEVTNPDANLEIVLKDRDVLGSDDFMGQVKIPLSDYNDGKEHFKVLQLRGEDVTIQEYFDRGEIEVHLQWTAKLYEDDIDRIANRLKMSIRLQAWTRRLKAKRILAAYKIENVQLLKMVKEKCILITCVMRRKLAFKAVKRLKLRRKSALKIQKRIRIFTARRRVARQRLWSKCVTVMNTQARVWLAKQQLERLRAARAALLYKCATVVAKWIRRMVVRIATALKRSLMEPQEPIPFEDWIDTYGKDPKYGFKRRRRYYENVFKRMLLLKYSRIITYKYGHVFVDQYPPIAFDSDADVGADSVTEDDVSEKDDGKNTESKEDGEGEEEVLKEDLTPVPTREDFVAIYFPSFLPNYSNRVEVVDLIAQHLYTGVLYIPTSIDRTKTVDYVTTQIQCCYRIRIASKRYKMRLRVHRSIVKFQRIFRLRNLKLNLASEKISSFIRMVIAVKVTGVMRLEYIAALCLQCGIRCWFARCASFDNRCVKRVTVLKYSSCVPLHEPHQVLDFQKHTFWMTDDAERADIRFELKKRQAIEAIWIMTCTHTASPISVTISVVKDKTSREYDRLFSDVTLPLQKGFQWQKFEFKAVIAKFFKLSFRDNWGDPDNMAVRQVRFLKARESSARILREPSDVILTNGPTIGQSERVCLRVEASGWPLPSFQWFKNGRAMSGHTSAELILHLKCELSKEKRNFRCLRCKQVCNHVPDNAYHITCGNCMKQFTYKEIEIYDNLISRIHEEEDLEAQELKRLAKKKAELDLSVNEKLKVAVRQLEVDIEEQEEKLKSIREKRCTLKGELDIANHFSSEGLYCCVVQNWRGGNIPVTRVSRNSIVCVEHSERYEVVMHPVYLRRKQVIRKEWNIYSSILGCLIDGRLSGLVTIRYRDGAIYEGPYISEEWLDELGNIVPGALPKNHFGVYRCPEKDGRIFEGNTIHNHFDPKNLQSYYRCRLPNGEIYEGMFCDEMYHGIGTYYYSTGSVYEGHWFKGILYGHGHFRSCDGWTYEGQFDANQRNGEGAMDWPDTSFYLGHWVLGLRCGRGCFISRMRDVYQGDFLDDKFHGKGELVYSNGSKFIGSFQNGLREGKGLLSITSGHEYYGHFHQDLLEGEVIVKNIIPIEDVDQANYEVRVALYEKGQMIKWITEYTNPTATRQFVHLFKQNREMFDSVYALVIAKHLPQYPTGLDTRNEDVQWIMDKLRREAGKLVGTEALHVARQKAAGMVAPIEECKQDIIRLKEKLNLLNSATINAENEKVKLMREHLALAFIVERDLERIEQYWIDDPTEVRAKFKNSYKQLATVARDDFFVFKNHRHPPPFVKRILDCISIMLGVGINSWIKQQMLLSDAPFNARMNDDEALRFNYDCKLVHMMDTFDIFDYTSYDEHKDRFFEITSDPRFRVDSYYVASTGVAGPFLVDWIFKCRSYLKHAVMLDKSLSGSKTKRVLASRLLNASNKEKENEMMFNRISMSTREAYDARVKDLHDLESGYEKAKDMIVFIEESYDFGKRQTKRPDYYQLLEKKLESDHDTFEVSAALESTVENVVRMEVELIHAKSMLYKAKGEVYVPPVLTALNIKRCVLDEIHFHQNLLIDGGQTLGYAIEPLETDIGDAETSDIVEAIVMQLVYKINDSLNEFVSCKRWLSLDGRWLDLTMLFRTVWKHWKEIAVTREEDGCVVAWENIWGEAEMCARMCVEARVNDRMSTVAKGQAKVWQTRFPKEVECMEHIMADEFAAEFPAETDRKALDVSEGRTGVYPPATKAGAICWIKYNPQTINDLKNDLSEGMAEEFEASHPGNAAQVAFKILNQLIGLDSPEWNWEEHALHWKSYNSETYETEAEKLTMVLADKFTNKYPVKTAWEAVKVIENGAMSKYITVESVAAEYSVEPEVHFGAQAYVSKNIGLARAARQLVFKEMNNTMTIAFKELEHITEQFTKGSYLLTEQSAKFDSNKDRFAGFRDRLEQKYAPLYGHLLKRQQDIWDNMEDLKAVNPMDHNWHNLRPTKAEKIIRGAEKQFLKDKADFESVYDSVLTQLTSWNTYFGSEEERQWYAENAHA